MTGQPVRVGSRGSALSLWQTRWVVARLREELGDRPIEIVKVTTRGDEIRGPLEDLGEVGLFTSALERALAAGRVDLAVHSLKDLPVSVPGALPVVAVPLRGDPADAVVARHGGGLDQLPGGARVGTSSPRRASLVRSLRPDALVLPIRGNVDSRVRQLDEGHFDAIVLAVAGLERLGLDGRVSERLDPRAFPPAPGQGALAVQVLPESEELLAAARAIDDFDARTTTSAERSCLEGLGGGCSRPIGVHAVVASGTLDVFAVAGTPDGRRVVRAEAAGRPQDAVQVGREAARALLAAGAAELLA